ncbi:hypothetical protein [Streptomyces sp. B3I8]|uniref:hypothetical protein n=1 Tax=Streptomyces sp. B3I8 TaxID=3042303 RepID=UPI0027884497|nr:hypothetical protein [Streptomyces sp. B3I8]MDQ0785089.1 hypothetical protein [Streptomyces sp. B3I8]
MFPGRVMFVGIGMIKEIASACCLFVSDSVAVLTAAFLASARAQAAPAPPRPRPAPSATAPGAPLVGGLLGAPEAGHPATPLRTLVPVGVLAR